MSEALLTIHRFLGESLPTIAVITAVLALFAVDPKSTVTRVAWIVARILGVLLTIQWLVGVINYFSLPAATRPSLAHPLLMTVVVAAYHPVSRRIQKLGGAPRLPLLALLAATAILIWIAIGLA